MENNKIKIPIGDKFLVAMVNDWRDDMPVELCVYLETNDGRVWQDICLVREHYRFDEKTCDFVRDDKLVDCKVWGDSWSEDYTDEFCIGVYEEDKT